MHREMYVHMYKCCISIVDMYWIVLVRLLPHFRPWTLRCGFDSAIMFRVLVQATSHRKLWITSTYTLLLPSSLQFTFISYGEAQAQVTCSTRGKQSDTCHGLTNLNQKLEGCQRQHHHLNRWRSIHEVSPERLSSYVLISPVRPMHEYSRY